MSTSPDPMAIIRSKAYVRLLVLAGLLGIPVSIAAYYFILGTNNLQSFAYGNFPKDLGFDSTPNWWPIPLMVIAGLIVAVTVKYLPGHGGESPADGFKAGGITKPKMLPGVFLAAFASISLGAVIGPEAPLIALGGGLAYLAISLMNKDVPDQTGAVIAASGSFAAISALLGSPILGAFLLMEASGLGGSMATLVLVPGLVSAGVGSLVFIGIGTITGEGTLSLAIPNLPHAARPTIAEFGYAIVIGLLAAILGVAIKKIGLYLKPKVEKKLLILTPLLGIAVALLAMVFTHFSHHGNGFILFSGEDTIGTLVSNSAAFSIGALLLLMLCKSLAYGLSLAAFRGGPTFPGMFLGAALGLALSHLPGLSVVPAAAMGIGAMSAVMLRLPITSVLLAGLLVTTSAGNVLPLVIIAVVVAYVTAEHLSPKEATSMDPTQSEPTPATT